MGLRALQLFAGGPPTCIQHGRQTIFYRGRREIIPFDLLDEEWDEIEKILQDLNIPYDLTIIDPVMPRKRTSICGQCPWFREDLPETCGLHSLPHTPELEEFYLKCPDSDRPAWSPDPEFGKIIEGSIK